MCTGTQGQKTHSNKGEGGPIDGFSFFAQDLHEIIMSGKYLMLQHICRPSFIGLSELSDIYNCQC